MGARPARRARVARARRTRRAPSSRARARAPSSSSAARRRCDSSAMLGVAIDRIRQCTACARARRVHRRPSHATPRLLDPLPRRAVSAPSPFLSARRTPRVSRSPRATVPVCSPRSPACWRRGVSTSSTPRRDLARRRGRGVVPRARARARASEALAATADFEDAVAEALRRPPMTEPAADLEIEFDDDGSPWHTLCEVRGDDRHGLLEMITVGFATAGVTVHSARIETPGRCRHRPLRAHRHRRAQARRGRASTTCATRSGRARASRRRCAPGCAGAGSDPAVRRDEPCGEVVARLRRREQVALGARRHPRSRRIASCASVSTPSPVTVTPRAWPRLTTAATIAASSGSRARGRSTKVRSIFTSSTGNRRR